MNGVVHPNCCRCRWWLAAGLVLALALAAPAVRAMDLKLRGQLIWGTNDPKPKDGDCTDVDSALKARLSRVFKWQNYFQIKALDILVPPGDAKRVRMSDKCELELKLVDDFTLEVKLFGEGKLVKTVRQSVQTLRQGELSILAGDSKDRFGDAWFVVLSLPKR
jgi:hypothetical protein